MTGAHIMLAVSFCCLGCAVDAPAPPPTAAYHQVTAPLSGGAPQTQCTSLAQQLDLYAGPNAPSLATACTGGQSLPMGGTLLATAPDTGWNTTQPVTSVTLRGVSQTMVLHVRDWAPQSIGAFLSFDLAGSCPLLFSSQLSGLFVGSFTVVQCAVDTGSCDHGKCGHGKCNHEKWDDDKWEHGKWDHDKWDHGKSGDKDH